MLDIMLNVISPIFITIGLVALFQNYFPIETTSLSRAIIYLLAPCLAIDGLANTDIALDELGRIGAVVLLMTLSMAAIGWAIGSVMGLGRRMKSVFILTLVMTNNANYGIPLNRFAFGEAGEEVALLFYVISATLAAPIAILITLQGTISTREALGRVFRLPLTYAGLFGLLLNITDTSLPLPVARSVNILGSGAVPAMLIVLGIQLSGIRVHSHWRDIFAASALRLMVAPFVAIGWALLLGLQGVTYDVVVVQSSMSTAVLAGVIAAEFDGDADFATAVILVSTLGSILSLSVLIFALGGG